MTVQSYKPLEKSALKVFYIYDGIFPQENKLAFTTHNAVLHNGEINKGYTYRVGFFLKKLVKSEVFFKTNFTGKKFKSKNFVEFQAIKKIFFWKYLPFNYEVKPEMG